MEFAVIILKQIGIMFLIILIGMVCYKTKVISAEANKHISSFLLHVVFPILIFMAYQTEFSRDLLAGLGWAFLLSVLSFVLAIGLAMLLVRKKPGREVSVERFSVIYSNCAFMGIPLISGIYGSEGVLYITAYITMFNLLVWTHGLMLMKNEINKKEFFKALRSPSVIAVFVGILCYVTNLRLPSVPAEALNSIASVNTPLAMIVAGVTIAQADLRQALKHGRIYLICFLKLILIPAAAMLLLWKIGAPQMVFISIILATACPTAATGTLFALAYDQDAKYSAELFAMTTLFSVITLPLLVTLTKML